MTLIPGTVPAPPRTAVPLPTPAPVTAAAAAYERAAWECMVLASGLHRNTRIVALVLAHHADTAGYLPSGGVQLPARLAHLARITPKQARLALQQLTNWHYLTRPDIRDWPPSAPVRPVTLTLPPHPAPEESSTGAVPE